MQPNYSGNKRRKEEARRKKQEEKRNRRLNKTDKPQNPETPAPENIPAE
jgi:hypothetical protein